MHSSLFGKRRPLLIDLVIHPDEKIFEKHYKNILRDGSMLSGQLHVSFLRVKPADLWTIATPLYTQEGKIVGAIESIRDITAIKKTENDLKELNLTLEQRVLDRTRELENVKNYTRSLIEADLDPLVLIGTDGRIKDVNRACEKITGLGRESLLGTPFERYVENKEQAKSGFEGVTKRRTGNQQPVYHSSPGWAWYTRDFRFDPLPEQRWIPWRCFCNPS